jgi:predicted transcriptional regulator
MALEIPIDLKQVEGLASRGLTEQQIADSLGVSSDTIGRRKKKYADFAEAIKRGHAKGVGKIANALFEQAMSGQVAAAIFYMKNRANWTDKQQHTGPGGGPIKVESTLLEVVGVKVDDDPSS